MDSKVICCLTCSLPARKGQRSCVKMKHLHEPANSVGRVNVSRLSVSVSPLSVAEITLVGVVQQHCRCKPDDHLPDGSTRHVSCPLVVLALEHRDSENSSVIKENFETSESRKISLTVVFSNGLVCLRKRRRHRAGVALSLCIQSSFLLRNILSATGRQEKVSSVIRENPPSYPVIVAPASSAPLVHPIFPVSLIWVRQRGGAPKTRLGCTKLLRKVGF